jgi:uncharacterized protein YkwD
MNTIRSKLPLPFCALLLLAALVISCSPKTVPETSAGKPPVRVATHRDDAMPYGNVTAGIINYVNAYRKTKGLPPLKLLYIASQEAAEHSRDMAAKKVSFGHTGFQQRALAISKELNGTSSTGENVAYGINMTPREVVNAWLKSPVHRANIAGDFNLTGVGVAKDRSGRTYYTQLFVKK